MESEVRPLPLKIAATAGVLLFGIYMALLLDDRMTIASVFWAVVLAIGVILAWFADQLGRRSAQVAAGIFFVLGLLSNPFYALAFLGMVVLCFIGFVKFDRHEQENS